MRVVTDAEYKCLLDDGAIEKAKKELGEREDTRLLEVKNLRKRVEKVPGLTPRTDINFLLRFLRVRKFDQEKAFESVKNFYKWKKNHPEVFDDLKPSRVKHILEAGYIDVLKHRDKDGCLVMILRSANWDDERYSIMEPIKAYTLCLLRMQEDEENQVHGIHFIIDLAHMTLKHALKWTPSTAKLCIDITQAMIPLRLKRLDYVHQPAFFTQMFPIFRQFMKQKIVNRLFMNNTNYQDLHSSMDPEHLPKEYGGKLESICDKEWINDLMESEADFEDDNRYGFVSMSLENKKNEACQEDAGLHGLGGTFKKLEV